MPWGADGSVKNLAIPNWDAINAKRQALTGDLEPARWPVNSRPRNRERRRREMRMTPDVVVVDRLVKRYGTVIALAGVSLDDPEGRVHRPSGPQRLRQDHAAEGHCGFRRADAPATSASTGAR